ncbi:hypothetical protein V1511DRAFT_508726 [Dipodascopsis uninucleata]
MDSQTSPMVNRLLILADNTLVSVLEHNRLKSLGLEPSTAEKGDINRNLQTLKDGISNLEREQTLVENDSVLSSRSIAAKEDALIRLQKQFDKLLSLLQEGGAEDFLVRATTPLTVSSRSSLSYSNRDYRGSQSQLSGQRSKTPKTVRFSENLIDVQPSAPDPLSLAAEEARSSFSNSEALLAQQRIVQEQDASLDRLSESISRQRELSIQIGEELDSHIELLTEVDRLVDWGQNRLDGARKRLDFVSKKAKENRSMVTIIILIVVLLVLIILLRCEIEIILAKYWRDALSSKYDLKKFIYAA